MLNGFAVIALMDTLFIDERQVTDGAGKVVAAVFEVLTPEKLHKLKIENEQTENIVLNLLDWKVTFSACWHRQITLTD